jgi:hypothetical protein
MHQHTVSEMFAIFKRTEDRIRLAVLLRRVCADQRSEFIVCDLLLISAASGLGVKDGPKADRQEQA